MSSPTQVPLQRKIKDPDAIKPYPIYWENWLEGQTISLSEWILEAGITLVKDEITTDLLTTIAWLSGGVAGNEYLVTNRITTDDGRVEDQSFILVVKET